MRHGTGLFAVSRARIQAKAINEDVLVVCLEAADESALAVVVRLRGSGSVVLDEHLLGRPGEVWKTLLTSEDAPFAPAPTPFRLEATCGRLVIEFYSPGRPSC